MRFGLMQPYFFPYLGYFQLINAVDTFMIYDDVNFIKGGWINRNYIISNKTRHLITLPVQMASPSKLINQIDIIQRHKILKTIAQAYCKAPNFHLFYPCLRDIFDTDEVNLAKFVTRTIVKLCIFMGICTKIVVSSDLIGKSDCKGSDRVINICKSIGANVYINAIGGQDLYSKEEFRSHSLELLFLEMQPILYKQGVNEFLPCLSIIDVLMYNGEESMADLLQSYILF